MAGSKKYDFRVGESSGTSCQGEMISEWWWRKLRIANSLSSSKVVPAHPRDQVVLFANSLFSLILTERDPLFEGMDKLFANRVGKGVDRMGVSYFRGWAIICNP